MKIFHLSNSLLRDVTGGTEMFVNCLAQSQASAQEVLWLAHGVTKPVKANHDHFQNWRLLPPITITSRLGFITTRVPELKEFQALLEAEKPDVLHLHSFSPRCGLSHIEIAKSLGVKVVVTIHTPGFTCMQGSLMYHRKKICDGVIQDGRCTECRLVNGRLPYPIAALVSAYDWPQISPESSSTLARILTARQLTTAFHRTWQELIAQTDAFHVLTNWSQEVLHRNGVPEEKIYLIRTAGPKPLAPKKRRFMEDGVLRCVYWGRCTEVKGIHLIIKAVKSTPKDIPVEVSFYGPGWDDDYGQRMQRKMTGDRRFQICGNYPKHELLSKIQSYDLALVPSLWLETGPLTVLEAFAANLPVAGSNLGGIQELLKDREGCFLLPLDWRAWKQLFVSLVNCPLKLSPLPSPYRSFSNLEREISLLYQSLT